MDSDKFHFFSVAVMLSWATRRFFPAATVIVIAAASYPPPNPAINTNMTVEERVERINRIGENSSKKYGFKSVAHAKDPDYIGASSRLRQ